jgi:hypothetical protein
MSKKIPFPQEIYNKLKSELLAELEGKRIRLDNDDVNYILGEAQKLIDKNTPRLDSQGIISELLKKSQLSEIEKRASFHREKIWTKEVRTDFINDILSKIKIPEDGEKGDRGDKGEKGESYKLTDQDKLDIADSVNLKEVIKVDDIPKILENYTRDVWNGKIKLPRYGSGNPYEPFLKITPTGDDKGLRVENGQLSVGTYLDGREAVFGRGDSHTNGMAVLSTEDDITYSDVTDIAASDTGSTYQTFGGFITTGSADYIGSDIPFCGIKLKTASLVDPGLTGTVAREYWNGTAWTAFTAMATDAETPYTQRADNIGTVIGSEQIRFGSCDDQQKTTVNGVEKYWVRLIITSDIVSTGEVEQIKLHTSRFEINADGFTEYFGDGIYTKDMVMHWGLTQALTGFTPQNETLVFANGISLDYLVNRLNNGQTSGRGGFVEIADGQDTSRGVIGEVLFVPLDNTAGDVLFQVDTWQTREGDVLSAANVPDSLSDTVTIEANTANQIYRANALFDVEKLIPGELLTFGFKRVGGDALDTYSGNIALINIRAIGYFWHP